MNTLDWLRKHPLIFLGLMAGLMFLGLIGAAMISGTWTGRAAQAIDIAIDALVTTVGAYFGMRYLNWRFKP